MKGRCGINGPLSGPRRAAQRAHLDPLLGDQRAHPHQHQPREQQQEPQQLLRQPFPAIDGAPPGEPLAMLEGISAVRIRVADRNGWRDDWAPRRPEELPRAVEITLIRAGGVPVTLKFLVAA